MKGINVPWHLVHCAEAGCLNLHAGVTRGGGGLDANSCSGNSSEYTVSQMSKEKKAYVVQQEIKTF